MRIDENTAFSLVDWRWANILNVASVGMREVICRVQPNLSPEEVERTLVESMRDVEPDLIWESYQSGKEILAKREPVVRQLPIAA
jgi:hypothetical protein